MSARSAAAVVKCCPEGAIIHNGMCYCTKDTTSTNMTTGTMYPYHMCRVICESLDLTLPPDDGGCLCQPSYAGPTCDKQPCYVYSALSDSVKFYCHRGRGHQISADANPADVEDCGWLKNLVVKSTTTTSTSTTSNDIIENFTTSSSSSPYEYYSQCPCFNGGKVAITRKGPHLVQCICPEPYIGDLCQQDRRNLDGNSPYANALQMDYVTANTFLALIAFTIILVTVLFCCVRRHQRNARRRMRFDFHRHNLSTAEYHRRRLSFRSLVRKHMPVLSFIAGVSSAAAQQRDRRKTTIGGETIGGGNDATEDGIKLIPLLPMRNTPAAAPISRSVIIPPSQQQQASSSAIRYCDDWIPHDIVKKMPT